MKRTVKFDLFPRKNKDGSLADCLPIRMRVSYDGNRPELRLGYSIEPDKWDAANEKVVSGAKNKYGQSAGEINKAILAAGTTIDEIFTRFDLIEKRAPSPAELKAAFNGLAGRSEPEPDAGPKGSFDDVYNEFTRVMGVQNNWTASTYTKFKTLRRHLYEYNRKLSFDGLTEDTLHGFVASLHKKELRNTTIAKNLGFLRWFLRWAHNKDYYAGKLHETFKPKLKGTDGNAKTVIYLSWEELIALYDFKFPANRPALPAVRDVFCFCCFTGLRYSDVAKLRRSDVRENHISVVTQKTVDGLIIELNDYSRAILQRYENIGLPGDKALPVISNVKTNEYLKTMGQLAGIDEPQRMVYFKGNERHEEVLPKWAVLTTHCGRRTFIVNALRLGVPAEVIMKWTGHSDFKAMRPYVKIVDELKVAEMGKFNTFGKPKGKAAKKAPK
jgi:integrase